MKERLDAIVLRKGWASTREDAVRLIAEGNVRVNAIVRTDPTIRAEYDRVSQDDRDEKFRYVGRGGRKLEGALNYFSLKVAGLCTVDLGAATGGFTDCLLKHGAASVLSVDVGRGLMDDRLKADPRVTLVESSNVRFPGDWMPKDPVDAVVADLSFISLRQVLPQVALLLRKGGWFLGLVKPQFEAPPESVGKGGIVRDPAVRAQVLRGVLGDLFVLGGYPLGIVPSEIRGRKGNQEYFCLTRWKGKQ